MRWDNSPIYRRRRRAVAGVVAVVASAVTIAAMALTGGADAPGASVPASPQPSQPAESTPSPRTPRTGTKPAITLAFGGDVNTVGASKRVTTDGLGEVGTVLAAADLAMVNLETVVAADLAGLKPQPKPYTFATTPQILTTLGDAGVDVVTAANNHAMDYGAEGMRRMLQVKASSPVPIVGIGADDTEAWAPWTTEVKGRKVVVFGATDVLDDHLDWKARPGVPGMAKVRDEAGLTKLLDAVRQARAASPDDVVVVYLHSGTELVRCPTARQQKVMRTLAEAGADVVIGSHAHILQTTTTIGDTTIAYGMGNFVFAAQSDQTRATGVLTVTVPGTPGAPTTDFAPARINQGVPVLLTGDDKARALSRWQTRGAGC